MPAARPPAPPPPVVGRYQIIKRLAKGGMAEILLGKTSGAMGFERLVAIKLIHKHLMNDSDFVNMFIDEARIAQNLQHSNIVQVLELEQMEGTYFIAMEYIHGTDLHMLIKRAVEKRRKISVELAIYMTIEALKGLQFAHSRRSPTGEPMGIVHRDISPHNIMASFDGAVKITDFGIAKAAGRLTATSPGVVKGKYAYMAPEIFRNQPPDARVDVFAAGVVLYELITGKNPYETTSPAEMIGRIMDGRFEPPSASEAVNTELDDIIKTALAPDPNVRYPSAQAFAKALTDYTMTLTRGRNQMAAGGEAVSEILLELFPERAGNPATLQPGQMAPASSGSAVPAATSSPGTPNPAGPVAGSSPGLQSGAQQQHTPSVSPPAPQVSVGGGSSPPPPSVGGAGVYGQQQQRASYAPPPPPVQQQTQPLQQNVIQAPNQGSVDPFDRTIAPGMAPRFTEVQAALQAQQQAQQQAQAQQAQAGMQGMGMHGQMQGQYGQQMQGQYGQQPVDQYGRPLNPGISSPGFAPGQVDQYGRPLNPGISSPGFQPGQMHPAQMGMQQPQQWYGQQQVDPYGRPIGPGPGQQQMYGQQPQQGQDGIVFEDAAWQQQGGAPMDAQQQQQWQMQQWQMQQQQMQQQQMYEQQQQMMQQQGQQPSAEPPLPINERHVSTATLLAAGFVVILIVAGFWFFSQ